MKKRFKGLILLSVTLVFLYFVLFNIDFSELLKTMKGFNYKYILLLIFSTTISLSFRAICFKQLLYRTVHNVKLKDLIPLCLTGAGLNILLPARAGDIFRAYYTGHKYHADKLKIFGSVMFERLFDVIIIFCLLTVGIFIYHKNQLAEQLCLSSGALLLFGIIFVVIMYKYNYIAKICSFVNEKAQRLPNNHIVEKSTSFIHKVCSSFFNGFEVINSPKKAALALVASFWIWVFECLNYLIIIWGFGFDIHWSVSLFVIGFIALAGMIPSASIFIGPYQVAVIAAFAIYGIEKESALAISLIEQSIVALYLVFIAFIFLVKNNISFKKLKQEISEKNE